MIELPNDTIFIFEFHTFNTNHVVKYKILDEIEFQYEQKEETVVLKTQKMWTLYLLKLIDFIYLKNNFHPSKLKVTLLLDNNLEFYREISITEDLNKWLIDIINKDQDFSKKIKLILKWSGFSKPGYYELSSVPLLHNYKIVFEKKPKNLTCKK